MGGRGQDGQRNDVQKTSKSPSKYVQYVMSIVTHLIQIATNDTFCYRKLKRSNTRNAHRSQSQENQHKHRETSQQILITITKSSKFEAGAAADQRNMPRQMQRQRQMQMNKQRQRHQQMHQQRQTVQTEWQTGKYTPHAEYEHRFCIL